MSRSLRWALRPQRQKTTPESLLLTSSITRVVNRVHQPFLRCEFGGPPARTVRMQFNRRTPCVAQVVRSLFGGGRYPLASSSQ
jgi:hypothetical protein